MKNGREQAWFVALVFVGTAAIALLAYFDQIGTPLPENDRSPLLRSSVGGPHDSANILKTGLSNHYFSREATSPKAEMVRYLTGASVEAGAVEAKLPMVGDLSRSQAQERVRKPIVEGSPERASRGAEIAPFGERERDSAKIEPRAEEPRRPLESMGNVGPDKATGSVDIRLQFGLAPTPSTESESEPRPRGEPSPSEVTIRLEANPKSEAAETEGAPSHQAPVKGIAKGGMTAKPIAHREDFLPPARMLSARTGVNPFAGSQPAPGGWAPPEPRAHDATRFADIPRPELPGGGPLWTRNHHPGLLGVLDGHDEPIHDLRVSPSGTTYITASEDGHIKNWSARTGVVTKSLRASGSLLLSAEWSEDWRMLALFSCTGDRCSVDVRDMESGGSFQQIATDRAQLGSVALSPNTTLAAIGMDNGTVEVLTLGTSHKLSWKAHKGGVWTTDFDPYGRYLATGGMDHAVRLWEPRTGRQLNSLGGHRGAVHSVRFAPNGLYLASAGADSKILLFRASTGEVVRQFHGHQGTIRALAFDPTGRRLASAGKGTIRIWDMASGEELQSIGWDFGVTALCFDRDGKSLLAGDVVGLVTVWDTRIGSRDTRGRTALWD